MNKIFLLLISGLLYYGSRAQSQGSITDIYNKSMPIDSLQGKKILLIVLPLEKDSGVINQLLRFQKKYAQKAQVIALVNTRSVGSSSKEFYKETYAETSRDGITISEGFQPAEKVDSERASVIQWISGKNNNRQLDRYATGSKYFLSEDGRLYAQLGKDVSLDDRIIQNIVNTHVPKAITRIKQGTSKETPASKN